MKLGLYNSETSVWRWAYEMFGNDRAVQFHVMVTPDCLKLSVCVCEGVSECVCACACVCVCACVRVRVCVGVQGGGEQHMISITIQIC